MMRVFSLSWRAFLPLDESARASAAPPRRCPGTWAALALALLLIPIGAVFPQGSTGVVSGTVKNTDGAAIPRAIVAASGPVNRSELSDTDGRYSISGLPEGIYSVTVTRPGYVPSRQTNIAVKGGAPVEVLVTLKPTAGETVVVTASRVETELQNAPAAVTVVSAAEIDAAPAPNFGDLLRAVPGLNVVQTSAREFNLASRQASPSLTNSQIALIDGRTIYADFFDIVFWDLIPVNTSDVKQIEVVRGPVSAVWGANAATGAINIITRSPREAPGGTVTMTAGAFSRDVGTTAGQGVGGFGSASFTYAQAVNDRWSYRASAGYNFSDAYPRPTGTIPISTSPVDPSVVVGGGSYGDVAYVNSGTRQPRFNLRFDQEIGSTGRVTYEGGLAGSQGIIQTPIGPFKMEPGTYLGYGRVGYENGRLRLSAFGNLLDGNAPNLLTRAADGSVLKINFRNGTYDFAGGYTQLLGSRHLLNYGGNVRHNSFDISIAPTAKGRTEAGGYVEDEILLGRLHLPVGVRLDKISTLSDVLFSPRAALVYKVTASDAIRLSYNRAHRSPSAIDNSLDISIIGGYLPLGLLNPQLEGRLFPIVTRSFGNEKLKAETLEAWEVAYEGSLRGRVSFGLAFYLNNSNRAVVNLLSPEALRASGVEPYYNSQNPPPGWPLPPIVVDLLARQGILLPASVQTLNYGKVRNKGFEVSMQAPVGTGWTTFANYSYQAIPETRSALDDPFRYPPGSLAAPPRDRINAGVNLNGRRYLGNLTVNHVGKAFWTDTRDSTFYGYTNPYTMLNCSFGLRWSEGKITTSIKAMNLLNDDVQQHIFGDFMKRRVFGEVQFGF